MPKLEGRVRWQLNGEPPPDGWRAGASWFLTDGTRDTLYTNAPPREIPHNHECVFVNYRPVRQTRQVSDWEDET